MRELFEQNQSIIVGVISSFLVSLLLTGIIIPKILLIAYRKNLFDVPDARKIHKGAIPRLGGIAFVPSVLFAVCLIVGIFNLPFYNSLTEVLINSSTARALCFSVCGLLLLYLVGIADDLIGVLYRAKFVVQLISAILLVCGGIWINNLDGFCGIYEWPDVCGCMLTLLVTVFFLNAINLIDGIDGLASGLSAVAMAFYGVIFALCGDTINAMIAFATLGTLIQFFYYNVFGNAKMGRKIFMGDTGALCIGFILTYLSVTLTQRTQLLNSEWNTMVVAFSPMLVPCFDVLRVFFGRIKAGKSPFMPDKTHIHHKLLRLGMSIPRAMVTILLISLTFIIVNVVLSPYVNSAILMLGDLLVWIGYHFGLDRRITSYEAKHGAQ
ncbi:MAG: undecaprenyl/decaprenyl-phosphate alpha-N-acetylglucosaminyl 1-phosphate transferase [Bacteroides sp.]|nr:undecaprenyl/decaprenyl-phosphate alpha-N-acetylglucosaminyl 1-phosphate transferase [Bacteroides sp.]MCM1379030.1 undecaprenyl/decaprenyl-phosphate alpha-N-acetylglucosaminyl 1-phosphate transferase [Bacteroides sp.]MCM1445646.1 undecaprenyl/decaprenyl-phosphate alpha-N-acetylglucosaminyl 1-phosphate transferase [Prevotella sp.]